MILISGRWEPQILSWLAATHGVHVHQTPRQVFGVFHVQHKALVGCFVVTWRNDTTAELHVFGRTSNDTWRQMFQTVFGSGVHRLEIRTSRKNKTVRRAAPKFKFRFEHTARDYYGPGDDAFVYAMTPNECRWLKDVQPL